MKLRSQTKRELLMFPPANILSLPEEVIVNIFSYLSLGELTSTVPKVCKQWERLHWDRALYNAPRTDLLDGEETAKKVLTSLQVAPCLSSTYFENDDIKKSIKKCISKINKLHHQVKNSEMGINQKIVSVCYKDVVIILSHLQVIEYKHMSNEDHSKALAHLVSNCCVQLKELKSYYNSFPLLMNADVISLCGQLRNTLRVLHLDCKDWTLNGIITIAKCRHLHDLVIHCACNLTSECILAIAKMSSLRSLRIHVCYLPTMESWISMISSRAMKQLTTLKLPYCKLNDNVVKAIGANLKNLIKLDLVSMWFEVTSLGLKSIIMGCSKLTDLQVRILNGGDDEIIRVLMMIPEHLPGLRRLAVSPRSPYALKWEVALKKNMPLLCISDFFPQSD